MASQAEVLWHDNPNQVNDLGIDKKRAERIEALVDSVMLTLSLDEKIEQLMGVSGSKHKLLRGEAITGLNIAGATTLPQQIGISCSWNPELLKNNTQGTAALMRSRNVTLALSPMLDVTRNATWGRTEEGLGEDGYLTSRMGLAFVEGMQGEDISQGVAATVKHFAGYGAANNDDITFIEEILMPHEVAIKIGGAQSIMPGYHKYKDIPASASSYLLNDVARGAWKFDGVVVSDYGAVKQTFTAYKYATSMQNAAEVCLKNGVDLELPSGDAYKSLRQAYEQGGVTMEDINRSARRMVRLKARLGLYEKEKVQNKSLPLDPPARRKTAYESACQSIVLLKNDGVLPIHNDVKDITIVGPNADAFESLLGDYTHQSLSLYWGKKPIQGSNPQLITLYAALQEKLDKGVKLHYERGCEWKKAPMAKSNIGKNMIGDEREKKVVEIASKDFGPVNPKRAVSYAKKSDIIIAAMGENRYLCGESRNRSDIRLAGDQEQFVKDLIATGKPVILIIFGGRPHALEAVNDDCKAVIQAWYPGEEGGNAVADILLGKVNPSAKLTTTIPKTSKQCPIWYGDGYTVDNMPLYPFGHGISYTTYKYSDIKVVNRGKEISVSFTLQNTGKHAGTEITQLYIAPRNHHATRYAQRLQGFTRVELAAGESKKVEFTLSEQQFAHLNKDMIFSIDPGEYQIEVGASSTDIRLKEMVTISGESKLLEDGRSIFFSEITISK